MSDKQGNVPQFSDYEKELLLDGGWQCSFCERVNANYVGSCACGHNKKDSDLNRLGLYEEYVEKTGQKLETPAAQMASAEEAKEDAASVETTVSQPAQPEPEAPKPVKNKYIYEDTELGEYEQDLIDDGGWQCGFCRRINAYYITSCACGHNKDDSDLKHLGKYVDPEDEYYEDDEYYEEEDEVAATETPASQPVTPQAVPTQATVSQAAHTATPVQSGAQPQARPVQPQAQAVQPQASVQPQVQGSTCSATGFGSTSSSGSTCSTAGFGSATSAGTTCSTASISTAGSASGSSYFCNTGSACQSTAGSYTGST